MKNNGQATFFNFSKAMYAPLVFICLLISSGKAIATSETPWYNKNTIRISEIPKDSSIFYEYRVNPSNLKVKSRPDVKSHPRSWLFRTMIRQGFKGKADFAGHYIIIWWMCGTDCWAMAIGDVVTGKIFHPPELESYVINNLEDNFVHVKYSPSSKIIRVAGEVNSESERRGVSYFSWENEQLRIVRFIPHVIK